MIKSPLLKLSRGLRRRLAPPPETEPPPAKISSPLFDVDYYLDRYPDVAAAGTDPLQHFLDCGGLEGRDPHPLFSSRWYLAQNLDVAARRMNPLVHYLAEGAVEGRQPHPLFDASWYMTRNADALPAGANPLEHYVETGAKLGLSPHSLFDAKAYLEDNPDVASAGLEPLAHFFTLGWREGRNPHRLFQMDWYRSQNPHVVETGENLLVHYIATGAFQGSDPNPVFDNDWYLAQNPDVREAGIPALAHYVAVGAAAGRSPNPDFDPAWYAEAYGENGSPLDEPLTHYLYQGRLRGLPLKPLVAGNPVAVVFLARSADGSTTDFDRFVRSYRTFAAGMPHDLFVIRKGDARKPGARRALAIMFEGTDAQYLDVDDYGFDIHAYLKASAVLPHDFLCFLNSHAEIAADDWLKKLFAPLLDAGVGLAGTTGSYESITDTVDIDSKIAWLANRGELPADAETIRLFRGRLDAHAPSWCAAAEARLESGEPETPPHGLNIDREVEYARFWYDETRPGGPLHSYEGYRRFPNPHVRTNGFIIRRSVLSSFGPPLDDTKEACNRFESGPEGLPARLGELGLRPVLVGADGATFEVDAWAQSGTFRLGDQHNVLIRDNRVKEFDAFEPGERDRWAQLSWGAYSGPVSDAMKRLGFGFARGDIAPTPRAKSGTPVTVAIVIPTHDRLSLVRDALSTIVGQTYPHWTCTVFDNASTEPVREMVDTFSDTRISYARSDTFLPLTESWNSAVDLARGDYVLLMGDGDGLTPTALETIADVVHTYANPDIIYSALYQFFPPGAAPWEPSGYVSRLRHGFFFGDRSESFRLDSKAARLAVTGSLALRRNFAFGMQAFFFRRGYLDSLRRTGGKVFQSPFPDDYLANVAMALARDIIVLPEPVSIAGVSRHSFGFTRSNVLPDEGDTLLAADLTSDRLYSKLSEHLLHGPSYNSKYVLAMQHVVEALGPLSPAKVNVGRYRRLQISSSLGGLSGLSGAAGDPQGEYAQQVQPHLSDHERQWADDLVRLGARAADGDAQAIETLTRVAGMVAMYAPAEQTVCAVERYKGDFESLPRFFAALKAGRLVW